ncbi:ferric reductase NAD binding domain-containing protein [Hygrophoropsis aurantiaca]|uniref:Ferric reductase NAD binding domain-containing protein n=1 Tax=Hygrophoropsis aurantiaca TaxID=72124 RepID=A0ACB8A683_9AGAM|nr:ferric reductase NAD binding domain-containing protein [Hygrophoropsis aurantiaca]
MDAPTDDSISSDRFTLYPKEAWYCLATFIFVVSCFNWGSTLHSKFARSKPISEKEHDPDIEVNQSNIRHRPSLRRLPAAIVNAYRVIAFRWTLEFGKTYTLNLAEIFVTVAYIAFLLVWTFVNTTDLEGNRASPAYWSDRAGMLAASQFPLITALGTKNNVVSLVTGISYEKLNYVHRIMARSCMALLWIHGGSEVYTSDIFYLSAAWLRIGITALVALTLLVVISVRPIRQEAYEFFFYIHFALVLIFLLGAYFHTKATHSSYWIWPSFIFWALDRFIRLCRLVVFNHSYFGFHSGSGTMDGMAELLSDNVVRLCLHRPPHFHWSPGQTSYLIMPSVSKFPFEAHPFTIASFESSLFPPIGVETEGKTIGGETDQTGSGTSLSFWKELVFLINVKKGFTKRLQEVAAKHGRVKVFVDGPYGPAPNLNSFNTSVLIAGGSGVSYTLPVFLDIIEHVRNNRSDCRHVVFIWVVREASHIRWIEGALTKAVQLAPIWLNLSIRLFTTSPAISQVPISSGTPSLGGHDSCPSQAASQGSNMKSEKCPEDNDNALSLKLMPGVLIEQGRPDLRKLLHDEVASSTGRMSVNVCGSEPIARCVRNALRFPVSSPSSVLKGGPSVKLHVEAFGYA